MDYFDRLEKETHVLYEIANQAKAKGFDVETTTEIPLAKDLSERVEGLVGPEGIAKRIKELEKEKCSREEVAFAIASEIASKEPGKEQTKEQLADQGLRAALAILTEGVVAAPLEGISQVKIKQNFDGSQYLAVYFAGPIRSAGGTAAALAVLLGHQIMKTTGLSKYQPIDLEIERYVEEAELYESEVTNLQYSPKPEELRLATKNIPVEVTGEQTDKIEVSHRDLERVETNNIRGGALLAIVEGVIQKSAKVIKYAKELDLDGWEWLETFTKKTVEKKKDDEKPKAKYIEDIIGGRPVLGYPNEKGGFRLRYGRSRNTGLAAMGVNPVTMELLEFLAVGTQMKIERPGKGNCVVPVDSIEGPIVKLRNGDVLRLKTIKEAKKYRNEVGEILFLGDMLIAYGEFLRNNQNLLPSGWCEEWWIETLIHSEEYKNNGLTVDLIGGENNKTILTIDLNNNKTLNLDKNEDLSTFNDSYISAKTSFEISKKYDVPLNPKYTYPYNDVSIDDLNSLITWIHRYKYTEGTDLILDLSPEKRILEIIGVDHKLRDGKVIIDNDNAYALLHTLKENVDESDETTLEKVNKISEVKIMDKSPTYIGCRVGRPEKSKERLMKPAPHSLFPVGIYGGTRRLLAEAAKSKSYNVEISERICDNCKLKTYNSICPKCGSSTTIERLSKRRVHLGNLLRKASENVRVHRVSEVKGVKGMISELKLPEPLEKGILRAKNEVFIFKDATIRHDSTDLPLTHFIPEEIGITVEKLKELDYTKDAYGDPIEDEDQIVELKVQDVVVSKNCGEYLVKVANFMDDLLERFYKMKRFYNVSKKEDLIGHLIVGLAPHTSAGVLSRIVGFTTAHCCYAHPYFHSAKRRNCDSDEDSVILLLDALINFSKTYLPSTRGGSMDAPLVLSSRIDPEEIDDESHKIDIIEKFPLEFFNKTYENLKPTEVLDLMDNVGKHLGTPHQYEGLMFSHHTSRIDAGPNICLYKTLNSMKDKVDSQIALAETIRAVDQQGVVEGVLSSHFLPDIMGNSRTFSKQKVRCTKCNTKYRRIPLTGKCKCGNNLMLTVSKGSVTKYLEISKDLVNRYPIDPYIVQRLEIQELSVNSLFESDKSKQSSLDAFF
ncbi:MAG: DNA polymerase II large subunit [Methanobrevibacter sp.]|jgi:DNA polymerase II large subunit|nr:DNA polymerase II large subunit [Candidatus Methanovirga aequatorialis]